MTHRKVLIWALLLILCAGAQAAPITQIGLSDELPFSEDAELMYIYFFDIGAKDSILILCGGQSMLIDCGTYRYGEKIANRLERLGISHIDYALNTHPHDDHIDGFRQLTEYVSLGCFMTCFPADDCQNQIDTLRHMERNDIEIVNFTDADDISFGGNSIWLYQDTVSVNTNYRSLVMHVTYGDASAILLADIGRPVHERLYEKFGDALKADIMKLPHHGLSIPKASMTKTIAPEVCVMTNWKNDSTSETLKLLKGWKFPVLFAAKGTLEFVTDGVTWVVRQYAPLGD